MLAKFFHLDAAESAAKALSVNVPKVEAFVVIAIMSVFRIVPSNDGTFEIPVIAGTAGTAVCFYHAGERAAFTNSNVNPHDYATQ